LSQQPVQNSTDNSAPRLTAISHQPSNLLFTSWLSSQVKVKVMLRPTVQSASLSWNKAPIWGLRPDLYCQTVAGLLMWDALSDERMGLSFDFQLNEQVKVKVTLRLTVSQSVSPGVKPHLGFFTRYLLLFDSYGLVFFWGTLSDDRTGLCCPRQHSLSRVRVPWDSWLYFTVSDLRLPFSSPPTTRRVTVEVFEPAFTRVWTNIQLVFNVTPRRGTHRKHCSSIVALVRFRGNVFTEPLLTNGLHNPVVLLLRAGCRGCLVTAIVYRVTA
jgi:hypothetical protein